MDGHQKKNNKLLGDEECINFRPSPNFKHMRKYLKSKFEESNSSPNQSSDPSTTPNSEEQENIKPAVTMAQRVQPPLPPNSPPPDNELVVPKQEIVDDEYEGLRPNPELLAELNSGEKEEENKSLERTMCRQYARGMCTRGTACIYAHEMILAQLPGVYTFCKNFQNTVCNFPKCKFVHASVFEKEHFYRTGYLPPHTLAHLKESNSALGPPTVMDGSSLEASQAITKLPPPAVPGVSSLPTSGCMPANPEVVGKPEPFVTSSLKREWGSDMVAHEHDGEPKPKQCKHCVVNELRLQFQKTKLEKLRQTYEAYAEKDLQLQASEKQLNTMLETMLPGNKIRMGPTLLNGMPKDNKNGMVPVVHSGKGKENNVLDQLNRFLKKNSDDTASQLAHQLLKLLKDKIRAQQPTGKNFDAL